MLLMMLLHVSAGQIGHLEVGLLLCVVQVVCLLIQGRPWEDINPYIKGDGNIESKCICYASLYKTMQYAANLIKIG